MRLGRETEINLDQKVKPKVVRPDSVDQSVWVVLGSHVGDLAEKGNRCRLARQLHHLLLCSRAPDVNDPHREAHPTRRVDPAHPQRRDHSCNCAHSIGTHIRNVVCPQRLYYLRLDAPRDPEASKVQPKLDHNCPNQNKDGGQPELDLCLSRKEPEDPRENELQCSRPHDRRKHNDPQRLQPAAAHRVLVRIAVGDGTLGHKHDDPRHKIKARVDRRRNDRERARVDGCKQLGNQEHHIRHQRYPHNRPHTPVPLLSLLPLLPTLSPPPALLQPPLPHPPRSPHSCSTTIHSHAPTTFLLVSPFLSSPHRPPGLVVGLDRGERDVV